MLDLVHALPDAYGGGEMANHVDVGERRPQRLAVTDVTIQELGFGGEVGGANAIGVNLSVEVVEDPDSVAGAQKLLCEVRTDETGAPDNENSL
jgi:hypothetical protein